MRYEIIKGMDVILSVHKMSFKRSLLFHDIITLAMKFYLLLSFEDSDFNIHKKKHIVTSRVTIYFE